MLALALFLALAPVSFAAPLEAEIAVQVIQQFADGRSEEFLLLCSKKDAPCQAAKVVGNQEVGKAEVPFSEGQKMARKFFDSLPKRDIVRREPAALSAPSDGGYQWQARLGKLWSKGTIVTEKASGEDTKRFKAIHGFQILVNVSVTKPHR